MNNTEYGKLLAQIDSAPDTEKLARVQARILLELAWDLGRVAAALEAQAKKPEG